MKTVIYLHFNKILLLLYEKNKLSIHYSNFYDIELYSFKFPSKESLSHTLFELFMFLNLFSVMIKQEILVIIF